MNYDLRGLRHDFCHCPRGLELACLRTSSHAVISRLDDLVGTVRFNSIWCIRDSGTCTYASIGHSQKAYMRLLLGTLRMEAGSSILVSISHKQLSRYDTAEIRSPRLSRTGKYIGKLSEEIRFCGRNISCVGSKVLSGIGCCRVLFWYVQSVFSMFSETRLTRWLKE